jgi:SHO1 osmosensor
VRKYSCFVYLTLPDRHSKPQVGRGVVGVLWFAIFLQLALIGGVLYTLASDNIAMNRLQISVFGAIAIVFAVDGANAGLFSDTGSLIAMGVGWLILVCPSAFWPVKRRFLKKCSPKAIVDILWVLYFTAEEDSLALHIFNSLGTGGLTPPSRRRRTRTASVHGMGQGVNGYSAPYNPPMGVSGYDSKPPQGGIMGGPAAGVNSGNSYVGSNVDARSMRSMNRPTSEVSNPTMHSLAAAQDQGPQSPLIGSGNAGIGSGGGPGPTSMAEASVTSGDQPFPVYTAKALYACRLHRLI